MNKFSVVSIAKICHEANRAYCQTIGDHSQLPWEQSPQWQTESSINGVEFHLSGDHPASASHENWMKEKMQAGWVYGPEKNPDKKEHPCLVPYKSLSPEQQMKDKIFKTIVEAFK